MSAMLGAGSAAGGTLTRNLAGGRSLLYMAGSRRRPREGREAGVTVEVEVFGAFTRALREADVRKVEDYLRTRSGEKQGINSGEGHSEEWRFEFSRSNPH